jgi:hypothetical protein
MERQMNFPFLKAKERLIRIMGTFDLATGHADTFDELLDSLESELRDVLGHYRKALKENIGCAECGVNGGHALYCVACAEKFVGGYKDSGVPAVETGLEQVSPDTPPQRTWVGLTDEEIAQGCKESWVTEQAWQSAVWWAEAKLKEKNT